MTRLLLRCAVLAFVLTGSLAIGGDWLWPVGQGDDANSDIVTGALNTGSGPANGALPAARPVRVILPAPTDHNLSEP